MYEEGFVRVGVRYSFRYSKVVYGFYGTLVKY